MGENAAIRNIGTDDLVEEFACVGVKERAVVVERAVLDGDGYFAILPHEGREPLFPLLGRRPRQQGQPASARVAQGQVAIRAAADIVKARGPGVHIDPRHAQGVVVVPVGGGPVPVGILEGRISRSPVNSVRRLGLALEEIVPGAFGGVTVRDVVGIRQVPGLGVAVAVVSDTDGAVHVGDHGHRTGVGSGCRSKGWTGISRAYTVIWVTALWRVGPVQGRVHRQQVRQIVATSYPPGH